MIQPMTYCFHQNVEVEGFQKVVRAMLPRRSFEHRIVEAGNDDRGNRRCRTYQQLQSIERTEADICDEQVRREAAHDPRTVLKSSHGYGTVACVVYELRQ